ncbi:YjcZ family sporulation protein [Paenibacillus alkalitolerans]|nr:YjcZ family sporulation protein [Paenibacillus alkalitolerans]
MSGVGAGFGAFTSTGAILVLFILLVIILRSGIFGVF